MQSNVYNRSTWKAGEKESAQASPKSLRTRLSTLSFDGSGRRICMSRALVQSVRLHRPYGWSLLGISSRAGNACSYFSTCGLIWSAMCWLMSRIATSFLSVNSLNAASICDEVVSVYDR